jgi:hypothetical protein
MVQGVVRGVGDGRDPADHAPAVTQEVQLAPRVLPVRIDLGIDAPQREVSVRTDLGELLETTP